MLEDLKEGLLKYKIVREFLAYLKKKLREEIRK